MWQMSLRRGTFCRFVESEARTVVGADLDPAVLPAVAGRVTYVARLGRRAPFRDGNVGVVTMTMVLHHVHSG